MRVIYATPPRTQIVCHPLKARFKVRYRTDTLSDGVQDKPADISYGSVLPLITVISQYGAWHPLTVLLISVTGTVSD